LLGEVDLEGESRPVAQPIERFISGLVVEEEDGHLLPERLLGHLSLDRVPRLILDHDRRCRSAEVLSGETEVQKRRREDQVERNSDRLDPSPAILPRSTVPPGHHDDRRQ
jgi:hypothetical protein